MQLLKLGDTHGELILLDTASSEYRELVRSNVCTPTIIDPALANGRLDMRDDNGINCWPAFRA